MHSIPQHSRSMGKFKVKLSKAHDSGFIWKYAAVYWQHYLVINAPNSNEVFDTIKESFDMYNPNSIITN